jgi:phosphatidylserine synthase
MTSKEVLTLLVGREPSSIVLLGICLDFCQFCQLNTFRHAKHISYVGLKFWVVSNWRFENLEGTKLRVMVFWVVTLCILIKGWQHFYADGSWRQCIPSKTWCSLLGCIFIWEFVSSLDYVASDNGIILYTSVQVPGDPGRLDTLIL